MSNKSKPDEEMLYMKPSDWGKFKAVIDNDHWLLYFDLTQSLGLRASETLSLRFSGIDFEQGIIRVKTLKRKDHPVFPLDVRPDLLMKLKELMIDKRFNQDHIFTYTYHRVWSKFKSYAKRAGLHPRLSPHSLRHLYGLRLVQATHGNTAEMARALRHAGTSMVARYVHVLPERRKEIAKKMWGDQV